MVYQDELDKRDRYLEGLISDMQKEVAGAPEGRLRGAKHGSKMQYFNRKKPSDTNGEYIRQDNVELVTKLAQKGYCQKVASAAAFERSKISALRTYCHDTGTVRAEDVYGRLSEWQKRYVTPIVEPLDIFVEKWISQEYEKMSFREDDDSDLWTDKGERVRSKSEQIIANELYHRGIPYLYEKPLRIAEGIIIHPDFTVLDLERRIEVYWEHFGMIHDPDYRDKMVRKISEYAGIGCFEGDRLLTTMETKTRPLDSNYVRALIQHRFGV